MFFLLGATSKRKFSISKDRKIILYLGKVGYLIKGNIIKMYFQGKPVFQLNMMASASLQKLWERCSATTVC